MALDAHTHNFHQVAVDTHTNEHLLRKRLDVNIGSLPCVGLLNQAVDELNDRGVVNAAFDFGHFLLRFSRNRLNGFCAASSEMKKLPALV